MLATAPTTRLSVYAHPRRRDPISRHSPEPAFTRRFPRFHESRRHAPAPCPHNVARPAPVHVPGRRGHLGQRARELQRRAEDPAHGTQAARGRSSAASARPAAQTAIGAGRAETTGLEQKAANDTAREPKSTAARQLPLACPPSASTGRVRTKIHRHNSSQSVFSDVFERPSKNQKHQICRTETKHVILHFVTTCVA